MPLSNAAGCAVAAAAVGAQAVAVTVLPEAAPALAVRPRRRPVCARLACVLYSSRTAIEGVGVGLTQYTVCS
eukprot:6801146-Prymnesium_polylepis.2